jgi:predicted nucleic acid-binding protein
MTAVAIDTSVLLAIFKGEAEGVLWLEKLQQLAETTALRLSSVALAEVRSFFGSDEACMAALAPLQIQFSELEEEAALLAGAVFRKYRQAGGPRTTILPDFLVAAHAAKQADALATSDRGYLRTYFPEIRLVSVAESS